MVETKQVDGGPAPDVDETTLQRFWRRADAMPGGYQVPDGDAFVHWGWPEVKQRVARAAAGLIAAGVQPGDRVALVSDTRAEWKIAEQAIHATGAVLVPVYPTLTAKQVRFILEDSGARFGIAEDATQREKADGGTWWTFDADADATPFAQLGAGEPLEGVDAAVGRMDLDAASMIIYTSGTTGRPKGVVLSHRHWAQSTLVNVAGIGIDQVQDASVVHFLPMAHVAGYAAALALTEVGGTIAFSTPARMAADLATIRPTMMVAVPRLYERILRKINEALAEEAVKRILFRAASRVAGRMGEALEDGGRPGLLLRFQHGLFERIVYKGLRAKLGFDRVQIGLTGAAAVRPDLLYLLQGLGLNIVEAYGMTESTGLVTSNPFSRYRAGSVGRPMAGTKIRLADDGEILIGGAMVFDSYWNMPDETAATVFEEDGERWLRSGDIGTIDDAGYVSIIDRKKELEILDTGKMVAPVLVEEQLKAVTDLVEDSCLVGNGRKYAAMLIQPAYDALAKWAQAAAVTIDDDDVVRMQDPTGETKIYSMAERILQHPKIQAVYQDAVDRLNTGLADYERVRRFVLVPDAFTVDRGELTPTFKKKRRAIVTNHAARIESLYS